MDWPGSTISCKPNNATKQYRYSVLRAVDVSPSSRIVRKAICANPPFSHLAAAGSADPSPPSAASAAGGWGIPDSRCVHSVGLVGRPAGGVVEAVARLVWAFAAEPFPSGGGALRGASSRSPSSPRPQISGSVRRGVSSPDSVLRRIRILSSEEELAGWCIAAVSAAQGVRSSVVRRLPSCRGDVSHPWRRVEQVEWHATGPLWSSATLGSGEGPICNLFVSLDLTERQHIKHLIPRQKSSTDLT